MVTVAGALTRGGWEGGMGTVRRRRNGVWFVDYIAADGRRVREAIGPGE